MGDPALTIFENLDLAAEALSAMSCPYWLSCNTNEPPCEGRHGPATCDSGCHEEPACMTGGPGWAKQLLDAAERLSGQVPTDA